MAIKKQFLKSKDICKVTFRLSAEEAEGHKKAYIAGSFNNWKPKLMKSLKDGSHKLLMDLETGSEYTFRYRLDKNVWINDTEADRMDPSEFVDAENGVLAL